MNYTQMIELLRGFSVLSINLRAKFNSSPVSKIINLDGNEKQEITKFVRDNNLDNETIYTTFNQPFHSTNSTLSYSDKDIENRKFILLDFDPTRPSGVSATNEEKDLSFILKDTVKDYLETKGFVNLIEADSGNGAHILIPLTNISADETNETTRKFLHLLSDKFTTDQVEIDKTVFNASRLTKLYGSPATKGTETPERPHRISKLLTDNWSKETNNFSLVIKLVKELESEIQKEYNDSTQIIQLKKSKKFVYANPQKWLNHYHIPYRKVDGSSPGMTLFIFESCPLKTHSNSQRGACLHQTADGKVFFSCLHASHETDDILSFTEMFPIPTEANAWLSEETLLSGLERKYGPYKITKDGLFKFTKDGYIKVSPPMFISSQERVVSTNEVSMVLCYYINGEWLRKKITGVDLVSGEFRKLSQYSVPIPPRCENNIIEFLLLQKEEVPMDFLHQGIGWKTTDQFLLSENFDNSDIKTFFWHSNVLDLTPQGEFKIWRKMVSDYVLNTDMELALAIGFSSIVVGYMARLTGQPRCIICSLEGESSTGKSTVQALCSNMYASRGNFDSFNATENSIITKLNDNYGIVYSIDEWNANTINNPTAFLYQLSSGMSRMRLNASSTLMKQSEFSTTIITSSETSIRSGAKKLAGIDVRILPFKNITFTRNAIASEAIKKISSETSCVASIEFMTRLFNNHSPEIIEESFKLAKEVLTEKTSKNKFQSRLNDQYAMILAACYLLELVLDIKLNENRLIDLLVTSYNTFTNSVSENVEDYDDILSKVFTRNKNTLKLSQELYEKQLPMKGRYIINRDHIKVQYFKKDFERDLSYELSNKTADEVISLLIDQNKLAHEKGRRTKRVRIDGILYTVYEYCITVDKKSISNLEKDSHIELNSIVDDIDLL